MDHQSNQSSPSRLDTDARTIQYLAADDIHPSEIVGGRVTFDEWVSNFPATVEFDVSEPEPLPRQPRRGDDEDERESSPAHRATLGTRYGKRIRRRYVFTGDVSQVVKIPAIYRFALQSVHNGIVMGGLLPRGRRLGSENIPVVHPALVEATGPCAPSTPQAGTAEAPVVSSALAPPDDATVEDRAMRRARARRQA